jgi:hypothetical protein
VLAGKAAVAGGNWAGAGDAEDFSVNAGTHWAERTAISDAAGVGRYEPLGATKYTNVGVSCVVGVTTEIMSGAAGLGVILRYVDVNNWLGYHIYPGSVRVLELVKKVAGVRTTIYSFSSINSSININAMELEVVALSNGEWRIYLDGSLIRSGQDAALESAGALKEGLVGLWDEKESASPQTRHYDAFKAWVPTFDQAAFASRALEVRSDQARREDSGGTTWGDAPYEGNYLLVPPTGPEKATSRLTAKFSRNPEADAGIDDVKAQLWVTPRYLKAPPT